VHPEAAFLAGYSLSLTLIAAALEWLGRSTTDPWASRTLGACRPPDAHTPDEAPHWPHSEVPAFHLGLSAVALVAAVVLAAVSAVRHVGSIELVVHAALLAVIGLRIRHVIVEYRTSTQQQPRPPHRLRSATPRRTSSD
jgi:hypothetical protein